MPDNNDLILLLKNKKVLNSYVLHRNEEELDYLEKWLVSPAYKKKNSAENQSDENLSDLVKNCSRCGIVTEINPPVGSGANGVMVVLNPPRLLNRLELRVMKKESEGLLAKIITAAGLQYDDCFITSLVKCEPEDSMMKPSRMVENCLETISVELAKIKPSMVIVMGDIMPLQKIIHESTGIIWHNIDHPVTLIKTPDLKRKAWNTIKLAMASFNNKNKINVR